MIKKPRYFTEGSFDTMQISSPNTTSVRHRMGVIVGASHHEPCCRSGGEFQRLRHENKAYGEHWSFLSNAEGISEFWKDGLKRNRDFESLITIGMRGENDSYLMPADATLEDNINVCAHCRNCRRRA